MYAPEMKEKYQKYKLKYLNMKYKGGTDSLPQEESKTDPLPPKENKTDLSSPPKESETNPYIIEGLTPDVLMAIIVLYNKLLYSYTLYRFRYDNTHNLIDITDLSDKIFILLQDNVLKEYYMKKYIKNLLTLPDEKIKELLEEKTDQLNPNKIIFTLRKDTATVLRDLYLINNESLNTINKYINFLETHNLKSDNDNYSEIYLKCLQIKRLVAPETTEFKPTEFKPPEEKTVLDKIRYESSQIINIIGNDFNNTINNFGIKSNNLNEKDNDIINRLFKTNFRALTRLLDNNMCKLEIKK